MLSYLLKQVICFTFEREFPKRFQECAGEKAMLVSFKTCIDYDKEKGYRYKDLLIYAPCNYVAVFQKDRWNVTGLDKIQYEKGESDWELLCYHDSCWDGAVNDFFFKNRDNLSLFDSRSLINRSFYKIIDVPKEISEGRLWNRND